MIGQPNRQKVRNNLFKQVQDKMKEDGIGKQITTGWKAPKTAYSKAKEHISKNADQLRLW